MVAAPWHLLWVIILRSPLSFFSVLIWALPWYQVQANKSWKGIWWGDFSKDFLTPKKFSLVAPLVKNPPRVQENACNAGDKGSNPESWRSPGEGIGNPLENSMDRGALWAKSMGLQRAGHDWVTNFPVFLPRKSHEQRSLASYRPWGCKSWTWLTD